MKRVCKSQGGWNFGYPNAFASLKYSCLEFRNVIESYFAIYESDLVRERKANRLCRKRFWAAGVNDLLCVDQHDKWKKYGLALHTGIEPFVGHIQWLQVWWTNSNPQLILSYHLDTIEASGCKYHNISNLFCYYNIVSI
jgi:hypothetical protein